MSRSGGHEYVTFGWIATIIGVLLFFAVLESKYSDTQKSTDYSHKCAEQYERLARRSADIPASADQDKTTDRAQEHQSQPNWCDLAAQQSMAESTYWMNWAAWAGVVFTGTGIVFLWLTLKETRNLGQAEVRAYLFTEIVKLCPFNVGKKFVVTVKITNSGQSPAHRVKTVTGATYGPYPVDGEPDEFFQRPYRFVGNNSIPANGSMFIDIDTQDGPLTFEESHQVINEKSHRYFIIGIISYFDVFMKEERETRFCYSLNPVNIQGQHGGNVEFQFVMESYHNKAT